MNEKLRLYLIAKEEFTRMITNIKKQQGYQDVNIEKTVQALLDHFRATNKNLPLNKFYKLLVRD